MVYLGCIPLHLAARYSDSTEMVRELVQLHPATLDMKDGKGDIFLHIAARYLKSSVEIV